MIDIAGVGSGAMVEEYRCRKIWENWRALQESNLRPAA